MQKRAEGVWTVLAAKLAVISTLSKNQSSNFPSNARSLVLGAGNPLNYYLRGQSLVDLRRIRIILEAGEWIHNFGSSSSSFGINLQSVLVQIGQSAMLDTRMGHITWLLGKRLMLCNYYLSLFNYQPSFYHAYLNAKNIVKF